MKKLRENRPEFPKRAVITGGMPYGNKQLHFGHVGGVFVFADVYARFLRDRIGSENVIFVSVILIGNYLHTGKRLALFLTDESGQFVVTGIMFNRLCLAIPGFAHSIAKREQPNLIRHLRQSRAYQ